LATQTSQAWAGIVITLNATGWTASQLNIFQSAKTFWESQLTGYKPGISLTGPTINAVSQAIDGMGGILGSAGPSAISQQGGFFLTTTGSMTFDTADIAGLESNGRLLDVIQHEMGHVLGIGTLWSLNNVYVNNTGQYQGASALAQYRQEFVGQSGATFVPVELGGGSGTANGHWDEVDNGAGNTGRVTVVGNRDMRYELMTGWLNSDQPSFVSRTTLGSLEDIGFTTVLSAVPEPSSMVLLGLAVSGAWFARKKSRR
jgi:hypothetical protein